MATTRAEARSAGGDSPAPVPDDPAEAARRVMRAYGRTSAFAGIVFAVLGTAGLLLVRRAPGLGVPDSAYTAFYADDSSGVLVTVGLHIVPFAGIAFLWYLVATRTLVLAAPGTHPELPRWLMLASGVVFVSMMFVGSAAVGAVALLRVFSADPLPSVDVARALAAAGYGMVFVYGVRAAGMFMFATTALLRHAGILPRWQVWVSYLAATGLLVSTTFHPGILLVFPAWVLLACVTLLVRTHRSGSARPGGETAA